MLRDIITAIEIAGIAIVPSPEIDLVYRPGNGYHLEIGTSARAIDKRIAFITDRAHDPRHSFRGIFVPELMGYLASEGYSPAHEVYVYPDLECVLRSGSDHIPDPGMVLFRAAHDKRYMHAAIVVHFGEEDSPRHGAIVSLRQYDIRYDRRFHDDVEGFAYHLARQAGIQILDRFPKQSGATSL